MLTKSATIKGVIRILCVLCGLVIISTLSCSEEELVSNNNSRATNWLPDLYRDILRDRIEKFSSKPTMKHASEFFAAAHPGVQLSIEIPDPDEFVVIVEGVTVNLTSLSDRAKEIVANIDKLQSHNTSHTQTLVGMIVFGSLLEKTNSLLAAVPGQALQEYALPLLQQLAEDREYKSTDSIIEAQRQLRIRFNQLKQDALDSLD